MKHKRILAMLLAVASCLSLAVSVSAASTARKAIDFKDFDRNAWYADAVSAAVDNGLLYGKSSTIIDPNGAMTRAEMAAIINRSFGCYKAADISQYKDVAKSKWYYKDVQQCCCMAEAAHQPTKQVCGSVSCPCISAALVCGLPRRRHTSAHSHDGLDRSGNGFETGCCCEIAFCDDQQHLSGRVGKSLYSKRHSV